MAKLTAATTGKAKEKTGKFKQKKIKQERYKLKLKGWLKTPADWAEFDAWAKVNAVPRKIPEPEPIIRPSIPLSKIKKRIEILSKPVRKSDLSKNYSADQGVSRRALKAKASKRIKIIARPIIKPIIKAKQFPVRIKKATLNYKATPNIIKISQPKDPRSEECKDLEKRLQQVDEEMEKTDDEMRMKEQKRWWRILRKAQGCPGLLNDNQMRELVTDTGVYRSAFAYEFTPWMKLLSMPHYRFLKLREGTEEWREYIVNELEIRGKQALEEQMQRKKEKRKKLEEERAVSDDAVPEEIEEMEGGAEEIAESIEEDEEEEEEEMEDPVIKIERKKSDKPREIAVDDDAARERRARKNAWRYEPPPWKDGDYWEIKESALKGPVSPRMAELAKPHIHKDTVNRKNPFGVKKSALTSPVSARMAELARPPFPRDPVPKRPARKKNKYGQPIFPMPPYGRKLPRVKPYKERDCPPPEDSKEAEVVEDAEIPPDPVIFKPTIDPYFDPAGAQRQLNARKAAVQNTN